MRSDTDRLLISSGHELMGTVFGFAVPEGILPETKLSLLGNSERAEGLALAVDNLLERRGYQAKLGETTILTHDDLNELGATQYMYRNGRLVVVGYGSEVMTADRLSETCASAVQAFSRSASAGGILPTTDPQHERLTASVILEHRLGFYDRKGTRGRIMPLRQSFATRAIACGLAKAAAEILAKQPRLSFEFFVHGISPRSHRDIFNEVARSIVQDALSLAKAVA